MTFARRILTVSLAAVALVGVAVPAASAASARSARLDGRFRGAGQFVVGTCGSTNLKMSSAGKFHAPGIGHGTYVFSVCVGYLDPTPSFDGTATLTFANGAQLTGTISDNYTPPNLMIPVKVTGGTKRFAHARGRFTFGPIVETHMTNCDPHSPVCLNWYDAGPLTGRITRDAS